MGRFDDFVHIVAYDRSLSTATCQVEVQDGPEKKNVPYWDFLEYIFLENLKTKFPGIKFHYIAWAKRAKVTEGIRCESKGGTDPTFAFNLIEQNHGTSKKYIHFITDGNILNFDYGKLESMGELDRLEIHFLGDSRHNIAFYQNAKKILNDRCNVYVNDETIEIFMKVRDGEFDISEEEQLEIVHFNGHTTSPAFNKLVATLATFARDKSYKPIIRKTLENLIKKSKGNTGRKILSDDATMQEIREIVGDQKDKLVKSFSVVLAYLMKQLESNKFNSGSLSGGIFLKQLDTDEEFAEICRLKIEEDEIENLEVTMKDEAEEMPEENLRKEDIMCAINLLDIAGPYILESSLSSTDIKYPTVKKINDIRKFPWMIFELLTQNQFNQKINVVLTPYSLDSFLQLNQHNKSEQSIYSTIFKFTNISFMLLHKDSKLRINDLKIVLNLNYVWASNFFFNYKINFKQIAVGSKFEIVYIYLTYLKDYLIAKKTSSIFLEDLEFTLEKLADEKDSLVKMPQFSIYYSMKLFKRILKESKIIEAKMDPFTSMIIRKRLNVESDLYLDNIIKLICTLERLKDGIPSDNMIKHNLMSELKDAFPFDYENVKYLYKRPTILDILRILLRQFIGSLDYTFQVAEHKTRHNQRETDFLFLNFLLPEKEFYFDQVPANFLKFVILSLNHTDLKLYDEETAAPHRNLDLNLILSYNENYKYQLNPENLLFKVLLSDSLKTKICWSTLRPQSVFEHNVTWSAFCPNLDKRYRHKARLIKCDSLHLSFYKHYLLCFLELKMIPDEDDFFRYLVRNFPFKTYNREVLNGIKVVVDTMSEIMDKKYRKDYEAIKKVIEETWNIGNRQEIEITCNCHFHHFRTTKDRLRRMRKKIL